MAPDWNKWHWNLGDKELWGKVTGWYSWNGHRVYGHLCPKSVFTKVCSPQNRQLSEDGTRTADFNHRWARSRGWKVDMQLPW